MPQNRRLEQANFRPNSNARFVPEPDFVANVPPEYRSQMVEFEGRPVDRDFLLNSIAWHESTHDLQAKNAGGSASGPYQFTDATNRAVAEEMGLPIEDNGRFISMRERPMIAQEAMALYLLAPTSWRGPQHWDVLEKVRRDVAAYEAAQAAGATYRPPWAGSGLDFSYRQSPAVAGADPYRSASLPWTGQPTSTFFSPGVGVGIEPRTTTVSRPNQYTAQ